MRTISRILLIIGLLTIPFSSGSTQKTLIPQEPQATQQNPDITQYFSVASLPRIEELRIPPNMELGRTKRMAERLMRQLTRSAMNEMSRLQRLGEVIDYNLLNKGALISLDVNPGSSLRELRSLDSIELFMTAQQATECSQKYESLLREQIVTLSREQILREVSEAANVVTDPSIDVYAPTGSDWTYVRGVTTPSTEVSLLIWRAGQVVGSGVTTSYFDGYYSIYPEWLGGCYGDYSWVLQPGDVVEVTAHSSTVSTVVASLSAWMDPVSDTVSGKTLPGALIETWVYFDGELCIYSLDGLPNLSDGSGNFTTSFSGQVDVNRNDYGSVYVRDINGNSTFIWVDAYHIYHYFYDGEFGGTLKPYTDFTATLSRSAITIDTYTGATEYDGWFYGWFSETPQSGDQISVIGGGISMSFTVAELDATVDPGANQVSGTTSPGRRVLGYLEKNDWNWPITTCFYDGDCKSILADGSGNFTLSTTSVDLVRGDVAWLNIYDSEGNAQYAQLHATSIHANSIWAEVEGLWGTPGEYLTINHRDSSNNIQETINDWASSWDGYYWVWLNYLQPGDHIEVGNGVITETMTVQDITASVNNATDLISGTAPDGKIIAEFWDYQREYDWWEGSCQETNASGGGYNLNFNTEGIEAADEADIRFVGPDGHYTYRWAHAFDANIYYMYNGYIWGYTLYPSSSVTVELWDGSTLIKTKSDTSWWDDGLYELDLEQNLVAGQRVVVSSSGLTADVTLPLLTLNQDVVNNRLYGQAPPNEMTLASLRQEYKCSKNGWCARWFDVLTTANGEGNYSASFDGLRFLNGYTDQCFNVQVGRECSYPLLTYYRSDEHALIVDDSSNMYPVGADTYEPDNSSAAAVAYTGTSSHTFHTAGDVDWIAISISPDKVGKTHYLTTNRLGSLADTVLELYGTNGTSLLAYDDDGGGGFASKIAWTPVSAGTYYVKIMPYNSSWAGNCGATYDFFIYTEQLFLPLTMR